MHSPWSIEIYLWYTSGMWKWRISIEMMLVCPILSTKADCITMKSASFFPPKSRNLRILQCLVSEDSWRRPICSWRAATGDFTNARGEHGNFTGNIGEFGPWHFGRTPMRTPMRRWTSNWLYLTKDPIHDRLVTLHLASLCSKHGTILSHFEHNEEPTPIKLHTSQRIKTD